MCPAERGPRFDAPDHGCPRMIESAAHPFARSDGPATTRQSCLGSARARPAVHSCLSTPSNQRARDASGRRLQSTCQRRAPVVPRGVRIRDPRGSWASPEDGAYTPRPPASAKSPPLAPEFWSDWSMPWSQVLWCLVTDRVSQSSKACSTRPTKTASTAPNVMGNGFPGPRHLPSPEEPFSGPFPAPHRFLR